MDRDSFIIEVYCLVVENYKMVTEQHKIRRGGFAPTLTDEEVITLEICGSYFKLHSDKDLFGYFQSHYQHFFPNLRDRPSFVRQAANLWQVKREIQRLLVSRSGQAADWIQVIDTLPLPVCTYTRAMRDRCFKTLADYSHRCRQKDGLLWLQTWLASVASRDDYTLPASQCPRARCQPYQRFG